MKNIIFIISILFVFSACKRIKLDPENTYIGTWNIAAIYLNGGNTNMKGFAETFEPCLKGASLEFTEDLKFDLQCDCDWLRAAGTYTFDNVSITAIDTLDTKNHTQVFTFADGFLSKIVEASGFKFDLKFRKIE